MNILKRKSNPGPLYVAPAILAIASVMLFPLIYTIVLSFNKSDIYSDAWKFVGIEQYFSLMKDPVFLLSIKNTFIWTVSSVTFQFLIGFLAAVVINQEFIKCKTILRTLLLIPWILPSIIGVNIWKWIYHSDFGIINYLLKSVGLISDNFNWLSGENTALLSVIVVNIWKMSPLVLLMVEASLKSVPKELKDAAVVDGASGLKAFFTVTVPHISSTCVTIILLLTIWTLNAFTFIFVLTEGGPANKSQTIPMYIYKAAFQNFNFGSAAAASTVLFIITAIFSIIHTNVFMRGEEN